MTWQTSAPKGGRFLHGFETKSTSEGLLNGGYAFDGANK